MHDTIIVNVQGLSKYTPQSHSPQIYTHCEAAGFHSGQAAVPTLNEIPDMDKMTKNSAAIVWHPYTARIPNRRYWFGGISLLMGSGTG